MKVKIDEKRYGNKVRLKNINLDIPEGKMTALIGTSGAGKSTIIKCITGITKFNGSIDLNPEKIAYIPQIPALNFSQTVFQSVYWTARLSLSPLVYNKKYVCQQTEQLISDLGLRQFYDKKIGSLSGGQRQRVSIAKEMVKGKNIVIADEIDTGLDCGVAYGLIERIGNITHSTGNTTLIVSHNLSFLHLYDNVIVLTKTPEGFGTITYSGSPSGLLPFFEVDNPVEILIKLNPTDEMGEGKSSYFISKYNKSVAFNDY